MSADWCIMGVKSGTEAKVVSIVNLHCSDGVLDIFAPSLLVDPKSVKFIRGGFGIPFAGYVFVKVERDSDFLKKILKIRALCRLLTVGDKPRLVSEKEIESIKLALASFKSSSVTQGMSVGADVKVAHGPFESYSGVVESINRETKKAKVKIVFCGQNVDVSFDLDQLKLDD